MPQPRPAISLIHDVSSRLAGTPALLLQVKPADRAMPRVPANSSRLERSGGLALAMTLTRGAHDRTSSL